MTLKTKFSLFLLFVFIVGVLGTLVYQGAEKPTTEKDPQDGPAKMTFCGSPKAVEVDKVKEQLRTLFYDEDTEILWMGAGDGTIYYMQNSETFHCFVMSGTVNSILSYGGEIFAASDGEPGVVKHNPFSSWEGPIGLGDPRTYHLYEAPNGDLVLSKIDGLRVYENGVWAKLPFEIPPGTPSDIHSMAFANGNWYFGTVQDGLLLRTAEGQWWHYILNSKKLFDGKVWVDQDPWNVYIPANIRELSLEYDSLLVIAADDEFGKGLVTFDLSDPEMSKVVTGIPTTRLTSVISNENIVIVTDWVSGTYYKTGSDPSKPWSVLTNSPSYDAVFLPDGKVAIATSEGLEIFEVPAE